MGKTMALTFARIAGSWVGYAIGSYVGGAVATAILVATAPVGILAAPIVKMAIGIACTFVGEDIRGWVGEIYGQYCADCINLLREDM